MTLDPKTRELLLKYAGKYETASFLAGDPSCFMHEVEGELNREATAFVSSALSFGSRRQFLPKIRQIVDWAGGDVDSWIRRADYGRFFERGSIRPFYRFYKEGDMFAFFETYRTVLGQDGSLGEAVGKVCGGDALKAVGEICRLFEASSSGVIPASPKSACKRICMFLRWMVRRNSPVDLGLWADFVRRDTLIMPLDVHVLAQSRRLGLMDSRNASMRSAVALTEKMKEIFGDDPLKGDFALFGCGVNNDAGFLV